MPQLYAQGWPSRYDGVMLQGFYWDSFDDTNWSILESQADELSETFSLIWIPQSASCGGTSMGYDDLYWFTNYNSSFGSEQQLRSMIRTFKAKGLKTIADVVINHRRNVSSWVDFPRETYNGVTYELKATDIVANDDDGATAQWAAQNGYSLSSNNDTGEGWGGMRDLDHKSQNVQTNVKAYLQMLLNDLGYAGFRYDMVKGYSAEYTALYNDYAKPEFSVGEYWDGNVSAVKRWIDGTKLQGAIQSAAFDFPFRYTVRDALNGDYQKLNGASLISDANYRRYGVTFVENHDTEKRSNAQQDPLRRDTLAANAFMLAMPGTPCVFLKHWQAYPNEIRAMIAARHAAGIHAESTYTNFYSHQTHFANIILTDGEQRLVVIVGDTSPVEGNARFVKICEGYHYAYLMPATREIAYADMPSGHYKGALKVRLAAVSADQAARVVYTTDGTTPSATSASVATGTTIDIPVGTTTLRIGLLKGGNVTALDSRTYTVAKPDEPQTVEIPAFCTVGEGEVCAFFEAPKTWGNTIHCWAWDSKGNYTGGSWPGIACELLGTATNGNKVWKWSWNGQYTAASAARPTQIIFNNNGQPQTADLAFDNGGYYNVEGLKGNVAQSIRSLTADPKQPTTIYRADGTLVRRLPAGSSPSAIIPTLPRGLYVVNGRKLIVR